MATLYIDFEGGNDNYGGTSFNLLASGTNGRITSTTFSSSGASFPNDGSLINQYLSIFNGTIYAVYRITAWVSSTSLTIAILAGGTALADQSVDRQYYIGGRWNTLTSGATAARIMPGDTIRVEASPPATSLDINGTWTSSPLQPTKTITSSTNATPIVVTCNSHGYSNGDTVVITGHATNTNANGTWEIQNVATNTFELIGSTGNGAGTGGTARKRNNSIVKLSSALTQNVASCGNRGNGRTAWQQSPNVTATLNTTDYKEGDCSDSIAISAAFTTGMAARKTCNIPSGYQQISFWIKQTAGTLAISGDLAIVFYTDISLTTETHRVTIPALRNLNAWQPITIDVGTNIDPSTGVVSLHALVDRGATTFLLSNIIACKAPSSPDSLTLTSLIGKNTGTEPWIAIQSINGTRVFLDGLPSHVPTTTNLMGYVGTSEIVTTFKRETIPITTTQTLNEAGTSSAYFLISGGWDRTNMSSQTDETYLDARTGTINILSTTDFSNVTKFSLYRGSNGIVLGRQNGSVYTCQNINHNSIGINVNSTSSVVYGASGINNLSFNDTAFTLPQVTTSSNLSDIINMNSNSNTSLISASAAGGVQRYNCTIKNITNVTNNAGYFDLQYHTNSLIDNITNMHNNGTRAISLSNCSNTVVSNIGSISGSSATLTAYTYTNPILLTNCENCRIINITGVIGATASAISNTSSFNNQFININTSGSTTSSFACDLGNSYCTNCTFYESTLITGFLQGAFNVIKDSKVFLQNQNNNSNNHKIYTYGGLISSETSIRNTSSGISWSLSPTNTFRTVTNPFSFSVAKILVFANKLVTIKGMLRRTNTALTLQLKVKGYQIAGVNSDVIAVASGSANAWEQVTLTFTPTANGVVEILGEAYGGTTFTGYIDDLTITQAT